MSARPKVKTALVTGGGRGIGLAVVEALSAAGMQVVAGARTVGPEVRTATPLVLETDLATSEGPAELVEFALAECGAVDVLVNNVGGDPVQVDGFLEADDDAWQRTLDINLMSMVRTTRAALPSLIERAGAVVNIGSVNARLAVPRIVAYSAAKAAQLNLSKSLAEEFGPRGVRVNMVSPGPVLTDIWTKPGHVGESLADMLNVPLEEFVDQIPKVLGLSTGKSTEPAEVAAVVAFLVSDAARNVNGAELVIDGGMMKAI